MKPITLTMQAFGPFARQQSLDFRLLDQRTLFLIHGPTGAGKTTILDAICFALYGETSGNERKGQQMRSDLADPALLTEITFDFALGQERYRVTRRPEQERKKLRGDGTTVVGPEATLWRRTDCVDDEEGEVLASRWSAVTERIEELLGFKSAQFRQVVVLPQGQFRQLLTENSENREGILKTLFQTDLYERIAQELKEARNRLYGELKTAKTEKDVILEQAATPSETELAARVQAMLARKVELGEEILRLRGSEEAARARLAAGTMTLERLRERALAAEALATLDARAEEVTGWRETLARARQATALVKSEETLKQRIREAEEAAKKTMQAEDAARLAREANATADAALAREEARAPEREAAQVDVLQLQQMQQRTGELVHARQELATTTEAATRAASALATLRAAVVSHQTALETAHRQLLELSTLAAQVTGLQLALENARAQRDARTKLDTARQRTQQARGKHHAAMTESERAGNALTAARTRLTTMQNAWNAGQAALLAHTLQSGEPCPVCGATEHPAPAHSDAELPGEQALQEQRHAVEQLETVCEQRRGEESTCAQALAQQEAEVTALTAHLGLFADSPLAELTESVNTTESNLAQAKMAEAAQRELEAKIAVLQADTVTLRQSLEQREGEVTTAQAWVEGARALVQEREAGIPQSLREPKALELALGQAQARVQVLKRALEAAQATAATAREHAAAKTASHVSAVDNAALAHERAEEQRRDFAAGLQAAGFISEPEYQLARRMPAEIERLDAEIRRYESELSAARDRRDRAVLAAEGLEPPDITALRQVAEDERVALETAQREETALGEQAKQCAVWLADLHKITARVQALEEKYAVVGRIADVANGRNPHGLTFQRFVLMSLLDDVLRVATQRLQVMSKGRYFLQRMRERADQRTAAGLDLEVYDTYTGVARPVCTLSGGESFLASLSLALGLADVVQTYAGGIRLETIFVDEGFGSLDPESLDLAFRALIDLQSTGRLVGIISHVPELKERIDARLEVTAGQRGSEARFVMG